MNIDDLYKLYAGSLKIVTDSREARPDSIFFALKGDRFDGNDFAAQALVAGCSHAVVDRPEVATDGRYIPVDDTLAALQYLARMHRQKLNIPVIAVTGTNGKTTTRELIRCVLAARYKVHATSGNFNNHIGVPLTLLNMPPDTEIAVVEMGANHAGEIANLCRMALPAHGLITNVGKAHLEGFGGPEGVKRAKKELYDYLGEHGGTIFYNEENPVLGAMLENIRTNITGYGRPGHSDCWGRAISASPCLQAELHVRTVTIRVDTRMAGIYNLENLLAAACVGDYFNIPAGCIAESIAGYTPQNNRSQLLHTSRNRLLLDCYNANPTSMRESLSNFFEQIRDERMVILGDMLELGDDAPREHATIVDLLIAHPEVACAVVGKYFYRAARDVPGIHAFGRPEELKEWLAAHPPADRFILVKGSRGMKLEQITELL